MFFLNWQHCQKNLTAPLIIMAASVQKFPLSLFSVQLLPVGVLEMTSAQRERRVSPSLLRVSVCCHGSSCHFLPEWVFLCSFIFVCTLKRSHSALCLHCHIWGVFLSTKGTGLPPMLKKSPWTHPQTHMGLYNMCVHAQPNTHSHTQECPCRGFLRLSKLHPFAHNYLHLQWDGM